MDFDKPSGIWCKNGLPLRSVLKEWIEVTKELARNWKRSEKGDVPWWYNERANLSVFAGGVWRSGGRAFEEFSSEKKKRWKSTGRLHGSYSGRVDLFFETRYGEKFYVEAKVCESGVQRASHKRVPSIVTVLDVACEDAESPKQNAHRKLGMVFVKPYIQTKAITHLQDQVSDWMKQIWNIEFDAMAWVFPLSYSCGEIGQWKCPGVVVLIKEV